MPKIPINGPLSLSQNIPNIDGRFGPYTSVAEANEYLGPAVNPTDEYDDVISAGLPFGVYEDDGSVTICIWTKDHATVNDFKRISNVKVVQFNGIVTGAVSISQSSGATAKAASDIKYLEQNKKFGYLESGTYIIKWVNRYTWADPDLNPYQDVLYLNIVTNTLYYYTGTALVALSFAPNEEDIDYDANGKLQLANRAVAANQKGYKILRKGASLASQMTFENVVYEIRYAFDLDGGSVDVPNGSVLKFNGGRISNGFLFFYYVSIDAPRVQIFDGITFGKNASSTSGGQLMNNKLYAEWFGAVHDLTTDCASEINIALDNGKKVGLPVELGGSTYVIGSTILLDGNKKLIGNGRSRLAYTGNSIAVNIYGSDNELRDLNIEQKNREKTCIGIKTGIFASETAAVFSKIKNVYTSFFNVGIDLAYQWNCDITNLSSRYCNVGIQVGGTTPYLSGCVIEGDGIGIYAYGTQGVCCYNCVIEGNEVGVKIEPIASQYEGLSNNSFLSCYFEGNNREDHNPTLGGHIIAGKELSVGTISFVGCKFVHDKSTGSSIYINKCHALYVKNTLGGRDCFILTENCHVVNSVNQQFEPYNVLKKSNEAYFSLSDFTKVHYQNSVYARAYWNNLLQISMASGGFVKDGKLRLYRASSSDTRSFMLAISDTEFIDVKNGISVSFELSFASSILSIDVIASIRNSSNDALISRSREYDVVQGENKKRITYTFSPSELSEVAANIAKLRFHVSIKQAKDSTWVSEDDDKNVNYFQIDGLYVYQGVPTYDGINDYSSGFATSKKVIEATEQLLIPTSISNFDGTRWGLIYSDDRKSFVPVQGNRYGTTNGTVTTLNKWFNVGYANLPSNLNAYSIGEEYFINGFKQHVYSNGVAGQFVDVNGLPYLKGGTTTNRPTVGLRVGAIYYDTTINKPIFYDGAAWVESDGEVAGIKRSGTFAQKPTPTNAGFVYFNTDTHKSMTWDGSNWYYADGTQATA